MIQFYQYEFSTVPAGTDFTIRLHGKIKFHLGKVGQFSTWYLFRFVYIFFIKFYKDIC